MPAAKKQKQAASAPAAPAAPPPHVPAARIWRTGITKVVRGKTPAKISGSHATNWCNRVVRIPLPPPPHHQPSLVSRVLSSPPAVAQLHSQGHVTLKVQREKSAVIDSTPLDPEILLKLTTHLDIVTVSDEDRQLLEDIEALSDKERNCWDYPLIFGVLTVDGKPNQLLLNLQLKQPAEVRIDIYFSHSVFDMQSDDALEGVIARLVPNDLPCTQAKPTGASPSPEQTDALFAWPAMLKALEVCSPACCAETMLFAGPTTVLLLCGERLLTVAPGSLRNAVPDGRQGEVHHGPLFDYVWCRAHRLPARDGPVLPGSRGIPSVPILLADSSGRLQQNLVLLPDSEGSPGKEADRQLRRSNL